MHSGVVLDGRDDPALLVALAGDPTAKQVAALAAAFSVAPSYLLDRNTEPPVLDEETLKALRDELASALLRESVRLPERVKQIVLGIVRQFENMREADRDSRSGKPNKK